MASPLPPYSPVQCSVPAPQQEFNPPSAKPLSRFPASEDLLSHQKIREWRHPVQFQADRERAQESKRYRLGRSRHDSQRLLEEYPRNKLCFVRTRFFSQPHVAISQRLVTSPRNKAGRYLRWNGTGPKKKQGKSLSLRGMNPGLPLPSLTIQKVLAVPPLFDHNRSQSWCGVFASLLSLEKKRKGQEKGKVDKEKGGSRERVFVGVSQQKTQKNPRGKIITSRPFSVRHVHILYIYIYPPLPFRNPSPFSRRAPIFRREVSKKRHQAAGGDKKRLSQQRFSPLPLSWIIINRYIFDIEKDLFLFISCLYVQRCDVGTLGIMTEAEADGFRTP